MPNFHASLNKALNRDHGQLPDEPPLTPEQEEELMPEPEYCTALTFPGNLECPPEYCDEYAVEGEELCEWHLPREDF